MIEEHILQAMTDICDAYIWEADPALEGNHTAPRKHLPIRAVLIAAAVAVLLSVSVLAAAMRFDALRVYFQGDVSPAQEYLDPTARSVRDSNYIFTVENAIADERAAYLVVTIQALNDETRDFLLSDDFPSIDTFDFKRLDAASDTDSRSTIHAGSGERSRTEDSVTYSISLNYDAPIKTLWVRLGYMEEGLGVEVPLEPVPSVVIDPHITGVGTPQDDDVHTPTAFTIDRVILSALNCTVETSSHDGSSGYMTVPRLLFRMTDGRVLTQAQLLRGLGGGLVGPDPEDTALGRYVFYYRFYQVQSLADIQSLILFDTEYPLDGSAPCPAIIPDDLAPFELPAVDWAAEDRAVQVPARALTQALGGTYREDQETGEVLCTYRDITIILRPGNTNVTIRSQNGQNVLSHGHTVSSLEQRLEHYQDPPEWAKDDLAVRADLLFDAWGLDSVCYIARDADGKAISNTHWLIIP